MGFPAQKKPANQGAVSMIIGAQWGDEGKGKLVDIIAGDFAAVARCQGGANAGHTIKVGGVKHVFHLLPSSVLHPEVQAIIGPGVVVHLATLLEEINALEQAGVSVAGRLWISDRAHIVTDLHQEIDGLQEASKGDQKVGTTKRGIGPAYEDKAARVGIRMGDLVDMARMHEQLKLVMMRRAGMKSRTTTQGIMNQYTQLRELLLPMICDTTEKLHGLIAKGKEILVEGANGAMLDIDHGTYPYVTSSNTVSGGACTGLGLPPQMIGEVMGIVKAYTTRVGAGPFPTELIDATGEKLREVGGEYGSTTGRPRRCGWLDLTIVQYAIRLSGITQINLTKLDVLTGIPEIKLGVAYTRKGTVLMSPPARITDWQDIEVQYETLPGWTEDLSGARKRSDLPKPCQDYVNRIETLLGVPITYIGVGPEREQMVS